MSNKSPSPVPFPIADYRPGSWKADVERSKLAFSVRMFGARVRGRFSTFEIEIVTNENPLHSSVRARIDLASLDTGNEKRDEHIRSSTFLDVANHPAATYNSTGIRRAGASWMVDGDLTLHGIMQPVSLALAATEFGRGSSDGQRATFSATALVNRAEYGVDRWAGGGLVVSDRVAVSLEIHAIRR